MKNQIEDRDRMIWRAWGLPTEEHCADWNRYGSAAVIPTYRYRIDTRATAMANQLGEGQR